MDVVCAANDEPAPQLRRARRILARPPSVGGLGWWFTAWVRHHLRERVERQCELVISVAPTIDSQLNGAVRALADATRWLGRLGLSGEERQRRLDSAAVEALGYLVAALAAGGSTAAALDDVEREVGRFAAHAEHGHRNPLADASPADDVADALHSLANAWSLSARAGDARPDILRAAASITLLADRSRSE